MANLLESYKARIAVADKVYANANEGKTMSQSRKLMIAKVLDNTSKFLNEALDNSVGTQRGDMGAYKKFALNLTNIALN